MSFYNTYITLHIIFAGIWLIFFVVEKILKGQIKKSTQSDLKHNNIKLYLSFTNLFGIIGSIGIVITGIIITSLNPIYGFFSMASNHWLATKQIIFVGILLLTFIGIIPTAKKLKNDFDNEQLLNKIFKLNLIINSMVILNFIFAITHRFYS